MKEWLFMVRNVVIAFAVIVVGELLQPLQALEQWMAPRRASLAWGTGSIAFLG